MDHVARVARRRQNRERRRRFCILERQAARSQNFNYAPEHHLQFLFWVSLCGVRSHFLTQTKERLAREEETLILRLKNCQDVRISGG